jgi:glycosyltransferase involved in cell wall biosynthesis
VTADRVLIVAPRSSPYGGIANYVTNLVAGLRRSGVTVDCYDTARYEGLRLRPPGDARGYWRVLDPRNAVFLIAMLFDWLPYSAAILRHGTRVVHVHTASSWSWWRSAGYVLVARLLGCRTILHAHNAVDAFYGHDSGRVQRSLIRASLRLPHYLVALSDGLAHFLSALTPTTIIVIRNGVHVSHFPHAKPRGAPCRLIFIGAVGRQKGVADLLEALSRTRLDADRLQLTVVGGGEVAGMQRLAEEFGIAPQVTFTGRVSDELKYELLRTHHVLALPSYAEGQPISILEGMAAGLAILSTRVGSVPEVIRDGENGFLVAPGDVDALADRMARLTRQDTLQQIGDTNRRVAREHYDFSRVVDDVIKLYAEEPLVA